MDPRGLGDLEIRALCFQVAGKHWLLFSGIWEQPHSSGDLGSPEESNMNFKSHLKGKAYVSFYFLKIKFCLYRWYLSTKNNSKY